MRVHRNIVSNNNTRHQRCVQQLSEHARQLSNLKLSNNRNRDESVSKLTSSIEEKDAIAIYDSTMIHDLED